MRGGDVLAFRIFLFARLFSMVLFMLIMSSVSLALDMSQIFGTGAGGHWRAGTAMLITAPGLWPSAVVLEFLTSILSVGSLTTVLEPLTIVLGFLMVVGPLITGGPPLMAALGPLTAVFDPLTAMFEPLTPFEPLTIVAPLTALEPLAVALGPLETIERGLTTAHGIGYIHTSPTKSSPPQYPILTNPKQPKQDWYLWDQSSSDRKTIISVWGELCAEFQPAPCTIVALWDVQINTRYEDNPNSARLTRLTKGGLGHLNAYKNKRPKALMDPEDVMGYHELKEAWQALQRGRITWEG